MEWFGEMLPPSIGRTVINVSFSGTQDRGLTWVKDDPRRRFHNIYLTTAPELVLGSKLHHEIAHVVLATRFSHPNRLPPWIEEGIAGRYDDEQCIATRKDILNWYVVTGKLPEISRILDGRDISPNDQAAYAVAASVTDYLLSLAEKDVLLKFSQATKKDGLDVALQLTPPYQECRMPPVAMGGPARKNTARGCSSAACSFSMAILALKASRGWSLEQAARVFHVTAATIACWITRSTNRARRPWSKFVSR